MTNTKAHFEVLNFSGSKLSGMCFKTQEHDQEYSILGCSRVNLLTKENVLHANDTHQCGALPI